MRSWGSSGHPACYWLAGFFFPHGFLTGVYQTYARKYKYPVDLLKFEFSVQDKWDASEVKKGQGPKDGVFVYGLFIENAKWDPVNKCLVEPELGEMRLPFPIIHFDPKYRPKDAGKEGKNKASGIGQSMDDIELYECPIYKTSKREGTLSTTGRSTNFIDAVMIPCGVPAPDTPSDSDTSKKLLSQYELIEVGSK